MASQTKFVMPKTVEEANEIGVSLCIPRVFNNINHRRIKGWFIKNLRGWGFVERVDLVPVFKNGKQVYKRAYVHYAVGRFNMRATDEDGTNILQTFVDGSIIEVTYDDPWFWRLSLSRCARPDEPPSPYKQNLATPRIKRRQVIDLKEAASSKLEHETDLQPDEELRGDGAAAAAKK